MSKCKKLKLKSSILDFNLPPLRLLRPLILAPDRPHPDLQVALQLLDLFLHLHLHRLLLLLLLLVVVVVAAVTVDQAVQSGKADRVVVQALQMEIMLLQSKNGKRMKTIRPQRDSLPNVVNSTGR